jgi:hypothetical protein
MHSFRNSDLFYESAQGQNSSMIGNRWYPRKVRLWTWNSKQEIRPSLADCFSNHSQSLILVVFMNIQDDFHLFLLSTKHQTMLNVCVCLYLKPKLHNHNIRKHRNKCTFKHTGSENTKLKITHKFKFIFYTTLDIK